MKRVAIITTNKILAQSLQGSVKAQKELEFELYIMLNPQQVLLDIEVLEIDVALIDMALLDERNSMDKDKAISFLLCEKIYNMHPNCQILLMISQADHLNRGIAIDAKKNQLIDDFIFYDASLRYLLAKLNSF